MLRNLSRFQNFQMSRLPAQPDTKIYFEKGKQTSVQFCCGAMQGWRPQMEDEHICRIEDLPNGNSLFAVFDGHGGREVSSFVRKKFLETLVNSDQYQKEDYSKALYVTFQKVDQLMLTTSGEAQLREISGKKNSFSPALLCGCTGNVILITKDKIYTANCGDSRAAVLVRQERQELRYVELSFDHKPQNLQEKDRIQKADGYVSNNRVNGNLNLSRAFGDFYYKRNSKLDSRHQLIICCPDITEVQRPKGQAIIVQGCDGIWEFYQQSSAGLLEIINADLQMELTWEQSVEGLLKLLISKNIIETKGKGCDNMTAIVIHLFSNEKSLDIN